MRRKGRKAKEEILEKRRSRRGNGRKTERKEGSIMKKQG